MSDRVALVAGTGGVLGQTVAVELGVSISCRATAFTLTFAAVQTVKHGYDALTAADAAGGRSQTAHRIARDRLAYAGAVPTTALAVTTELVRDWASPPAGPLREAINRYFGDVPRLTDQVGVAEAEQLAAAAAKEGH